VIQLGTVGALSEIRPSELIYVKEIMQRDVKTARPESTAKEVVEKMNRFNIGSIVILQKKRTVADRGFEMVPQKRQESPARSTIPRTKCPMDHSLRSS
jgi:predicted transcriptional regulator